ncbi:putative cryptochrome/photolyase domain superfamily [Helianthus anomalus]
MPLVQNRSSCDDHPGLIAASKHSMVAPLYVFDHRILRDCRGLVHLFSCRCLQMWSTDYRRFASEKTNNTCMSVVRW